MVFASLDRQHYDGCIVAKPATAILGDGFHELALDVFRVAPAKLQQSLRYTLLAEFRAEEVFSLSDAVGEKHEAVAALQLQPAVPVSPVGQNPEHGAVAGKSERIAGAPHQ